jgi:hypothetical protein
VGRPTICQSVTTERSCSENSKSKGCIQRKVIFIFKNDNLYNGVAWGTCYSMEYFESSKGRIYLEAETQKGKVVLLKPRLLVANTSYYY